MPRPRPSGCSSRIDDRACSRAGARVSGRVPCSGSAMMQRGHHGIHGWLLLLPAMALLALFTHWPALATFIDSFRSTPRPRRPALFVGLGNYKSMLADAVFWQSVV